MLQEPSSKDQANSQPDLSETLETSQPLSSTTTINEEKLYPFRFAFLLVALVIIGALFFVIYQFSLRHSLFSMTVESTSTPTPIATATPAPTPLPKASKLLFAGGGGIYESNVDGSSQEIIMNGEPYNPFHLEKKTSTPITPMVSPDGKYLFYSIMNVPEVWIQELHAVVSPLPISRFLNGPALVQDKVAFSPDDKYYAVLAQTPLSTQMQYRQGDTRNIYIIPFTDTIAKNIVSLPPAADVCTPPKALSPADEVYGQEVGNLDGNNPTFYWLDSTTFLTDISCNQGLQVVDIPSGEARPINPDETRVALSPSGKYVAGIQNENQIIITDTRTWQNESMLEEDAEKGDMIDRVAWVNDDEFVYSVIHATSTYQFNALALSRLQQIGRPNLRNFPLHSYTISVRTYNIKTKDGQELWTEAGWRGIPKMVVNGNTLIMSMIRDDTDVVKSLEDTQGDASEEVSMTWPMNTLFTLDLTKPGQPEMLKTFAGSPTLVFTK